MARTLAVLHIALLSWSRGLEVEVDTFPSVQYLLTQGNLTQATHEAIAIYSHDLTASYLGNVTRFSSNLRKVTYSPTFSAGNFQTNTAVQNHLNLRPDIPRNSSVLSIYVGHDASI